MTIKDAPPHRQDDARTVDAPPALDIAGTDSAAVLMRYGQRLTIAQAPMRALAAMKVAGSA